MIKGRKELCERVSSLEKKWVKGLWGYPLKPLVSWRKWRGGISETQIKQLGGNFKKADVCPAIGKLWCSQPLHICQEFTRVHEWLGSLWERNLLCNLAVRTAQYQILGTDYWQRLTADADQESLLKTANRNFHWEAQATVSLQITERSKAMYCPLLCETCSIRFYQTSRKKKVNDDPV